jgi:nucleoside-diphosphate-sugar epimerase
MKDTSILITGGCGFIGSNLSLLLKEKYPAYQVVALDNLKRRGSELNIPRLKEAGVEYIHGDIRNTEDLSLERKFDFIIDAAAEPSLMARSIPWSLLQEVVRSSYFFPPAGYILYRISKTSTTPKAKQGLSFPKFNRFRA